MSLWLIITLAIVIILALAGYAGKLLWQLKQQTAEERAKEQQQQAQKQKNIKRLADSIDTIAKAMQQGQCDYSEGTIRICVLLDHLLPNLDDAPNYTQRYPQFHGFYNQIKHLATHKQRSNLPANERMQQDLHRIKHEEQSKPAIESEELPKLREEMQSYLQPTLH